MAALSRATWLAGLGVAALRPTIAGAADARAVRIGSAKTDATAQHYYAQDQGLFAQAGISAEISALRNASELSAAVLGGSLDVIAGSLVPIAQAHNHGQNLVTIALGNVYTGPPPQGVVVAAPGSPIKSGADLRGKTVSVNGLGDFSQVVLAAWIDCTGGDSTTVKFLEVPFTAVPPALQQGRIDAALLVEPFTTAAVAKGQVRVIGDALGAVGKHFMVTGWYARSDWLGANRDLARRFVDAMIAAAKWANRNHDLSAAILSKYTGVPVDVINGTPRAAYGEVLPSPDWLQPVLDYAAKYVGLEKTNGAALIWRA